MATITFEIPEAIEKFIKDELKVEPKTFIQNELVDPIIKKFEVWLKNKRVTEAKDQAQAEVASAKTAMKVKLNGVK